MRKEPNDKIRVFNGADGEFLAKITELKKNSAAVELLEQLAPQENSPDIWIIASPIKKDAFDMMIEKACELGASRFIPVTFERSVVHRLNQERLQAIALEAAEQSERLDLMLIDELKDFKKMLESLPQERELIFCLERAAAAPLAETAQKIKDKPKAIIIGPEGGFSDQEIDFISNFNNIHPVSLGRRILRAETALIAALAAVQLLAD